jgi:hypothetical protein
MKKSLLVVLGVFIACLKGFSQADFDLLPDTALVVHQVNTGDVAEGFITVKNISNHNDTIKWVGLAKTGPHDWSTNVCDIVNCYAFSYIVRTFVLTPGDTGVMRMDLDAACMAGTGEIRLMMWVNGDSAGKVLYPNWQLDVTVANGCTVGINDQFNSNTLAIYPNPVKSTFTVAGIENAGNLSFEVYDLQGALAKSEIKGATNTSIEISIETLPPGTYVLKAVDEKGRIAGTARLMKHP